MDAVPIYHNLLVVFRLINKINVSSDDRDSIISRDKLGVRIRVQWKLSRLILSYEAFIVMRIAKKIK